MIFLKKVSKLDQIITFVTQIIYMRTILIIGAGRSASSLIQYLLDKSAEENLHLVIADLSLELANNSP